MSSREALQPNTLLDFSGMPCRVDSLLGRGSNALVYLGRYAGPQAPEEGSAVLIKELFPLDPQERIFRDAQGAIRILPEAEELWQQHRQRFLDSCDIHQRLLYDHPELSGITMHSVSLGKTLYCVVDFPQGRPLSRELQAPARDLKKLTVRMLGLLDALEAVHKCGFLHLDIRPETVMLAENAGKEEIFLMDFNSTMPMDHQTSSFLSYRPGYSAPEVENTASAMADFSSDLYSVTAVFYHALMGRPLSLEEMLLSRPPDGQDSPCLEGLPLPAKAQVRTILRKGLSVLPTRRYRSTGQMRLALKELLDRIDHPENYPAPDTSVVTALPRRRRPAFRI